MPLFLGCTKKMMFSFVWIQHILAKKISEDLRRVSNKMSGLLKIPQGQGKRLKF